MSYTYGFASAHENGTYFHFAQKCADNVNCAVFYKHSEIPGSKKLRVGRCCFCYILLLTCTIAALPVSVQGITNTIIKSKQEIASLQYEHANMTRTTGFRMMVIMYGTGILILSKELMNRPSENTTRQSFSSRVDKSHFAILYLGKYCK